MLQGHEGPEQDLQTPGSGFFGRISCLDLTGSSYSITDFEYEAVARRSFFSLGSYRRGHVTLADARIENEAVQSEPI